MSKTIRYIAVGAVAVVLGVCLALTLVARGQADSLRGQIAQLQSSQAALSKAAQTAKSANLARLGICWSVGNQFFSDTGNPYVSDVSISQAVIQDGVYTCPQGEVFVSVVPIKALSPAP